MGFFSRFFRRRRKSPPPFKGDALPEAAYDSDQGKNFVLRILENRAGPDGSRVFRAYGLDRGERVGLEVSWGPRWETVAVEADFPGNLLGNIVTFKSLGSESDGLVKAMSRHYGAGISPPGMKPMVSFSAISLQGDPRDLSKGPVMIKLFFEGEEEKENTSLESEEGEVEEEGLYGEIFLVVSLEEESLLLMEKDEDYREGLVRILSSF